MATHLEFCSAALMQGQFFCFYLFFFFCMMTGWTEIKGPHGNVFVNKLGGRKMWFSLASVAFALSLWSICSCGSLACCSDPQHRHTRHHFSLFIYMLWMCVEPLGLFCSQLSYHSEDFHWPTLRAGGGQAALLQESAQDLTKSTSLDISPKKPLRLHFVPGFPPMDPYHF